MNRSTLSHLETSALIAFIEVAERGSFTAAAVALNLSQPTISQQVRRLERFVGIKLLHRRSNQVYLSQAGEAFISHCRAGLQNIETGIDSALRASQATAGKVTLGLTCFNIQRCLSNVLQRYCQQNPNVSIQILEGVPGDLVQGLQNQTIDLAIFSLPVPVKLLEFEELYEEPLLLVAGPDHPLTLVKDVTWHDIQHQPLLIPRQETDFGIRYIIEELYFTHQSKLNPAVEVTGCQSFQHLLGANCGVAYLPRSQVQKDLERGSLVDIKLPLALSLTHKVAIASHPKYPLSPAAKKLAETMRKVVHLPKVQVLSK